MEMKPISIESKACEWHVRDKVLLVIQALWPKGSEKKMHIELQLDNAGPHAGWMEKMIEGEDQKDG